MIILVVVEESTRFKIKRARKMVSPHQEQVRSFVGPFIVEVLAEDEGLQSCLLVAPIPRASISSALVMINLFSFSSIVRVVIEIVSVLLRL